MAPSGELWEWGPVDAEQSVRGSAYDFCLLVTQRRHRDDLDLVATGPDADQLARHRPGVRRPRRRRTEAGRMNEVLRVGNCSGFYGDRLSAMRELLEGATEGHGLDVVTGDYLAELTMLILGKDQLKDPSLGYARTFVAQVSDCLGLALEKGVRIVANAGGLNPAGLAEKLREVGDAAGPLAADRVGRRRQPGAAGRGARPRRSTHRQRLSRRVRDRAGAGGRRGHRRDRPGHRRVGGRRPGGLEVRLVARATSTSWPVPSSPGT